MVPIRFVVRSLCVAVAVLLAVPLATAADTKIDPAALKKVKAATVHIKVTFDDGDTTEGTGFATRAPGLIVTNAHVVGMLDNDSKRPSKVEVTLNSGEENSKTMVAVVGHVDGDADIAMLALPQAEAKNFPPLLPTGLAQDLSETQDVFIVGFPLGRKIGANVTVTATTVTSLRKEGRTVQQVQVNGGMHPGNSGGPVVDKGGNLVGIAVAGYADTQIHMAISTERMNVVMNGHLPHTFGIAYKDGTKIRVPVRVEKVDPLGRFKTVNFETWLGRPGPDRPLVDKRPDPLPGDTPVTVTKLKADDKGVLTGELVFDGLPDPKQAVWLRFQVEMTEGRTVWYPGHIITYRMANPVDRQPVQLKYAPPTDDTDGLSVTSDSGFRIREGGGEDHALAMTLKGLLRERVAAAEKDKGWRRTVGYDAVNMAITVDKVPVDSSRKLTAALKDVTLMFTTLEVGADGKVVGGKTDLGTAPVSSRVPLEVVADQTAESLTALSLPLPAKKLKPLDTWTGKNTYSVGALGWAVPAVANITYRYEGTVTRGGRTLAVLSLEGTLEAVSAKKPGKPDPKAKVPKVHGKVSGALDVDVETGVMGGAFQRVRAEVDTEMDGKSLKAIGDLVVSFNRLPPKK